MNAAARNVVANVSARDGKPQQAYETTSMLNAAAMAPIVQAKFRRPSVRKKNQADSPRSTRQMGVHHLRYSTAFCSNRPSAM